MAKGAKASVPTGGQDSQEEMTVVVLRIKGQGDTLRKGFDALNHAFAALGPGQAVIGTKRLSAGQSKAAERVEEDQGADIESEGEVEEDEAPTIEGSSASTNGKSRPRSKPRFIDKFDLTVSDKPWKDFAAEHAPQTDYEKYLLAARWVTENANTPDFSLGHIFTCFRAVKWPEQADFSQPLRKMKQNNSYFENPTPKTWKLTQIGLDAAKAIAKAGPQ